MSEGYTTLQQDLRTFGDQQQRLLEDLNRPDLSGIVIKYLQDAMRYYQRFPFFFSDLDNTAAVAWAASTHYPQGSAIQFTNGGNTYLAVALNAGLSNATTAPTFPTTIFQIPQGSPLPFPPPASGTAGTVDDNGGAPTGIIWATVINLTTARQTQQFWTQLVTVYNVNQYIPPIDYVAPRLVEITAASMRYALQSVPYPELRGMDVIRPTPVTVYPQFWAWYQEQIYVWPYPNGFYPLTLSYRTAPQLARNATDVNFWTTDAELMVRAYAEFLIQMKVLKDPDAAQAAYAVAQRELLAIKSQTISQQVPMGIPPDVW